MRALILALVSALALAGPAGADDADVKTLRQARLIEYWADNCQFPASETNRWTTIQPGRDGVVRSSETSGAWTSVYRITQATILPNGDVAMKMIWEGDGPLHDIVYRMEKNRFRVWTSVKLPAGRKLVVAGVVTPSGRPNSWSNRCPD